MGVRSNRTGNDLYEQKAYTTSMRLMPSGSFTSCIITDNLLRVSFHKPYYQNRYDPQVKQEGSNPNPRIDSANTFRAEE